MAAAPAVSSNRVSRETLGRYDVFGSIRQSRVRNSSAIVRLPDPRTESWQDVISDKPSRAYDGRDAAIGSVNPSARETNRE